MELELRGRAMVQHNHHHFSKRIAYLFERGHLHGEPYGREQRGDQHIIAVELYRSESSKAHPCIFRHPHIWYTPADRFVHRWIIEYHRLGLVLWR